METATIFRCVRYGWFTTLILCAGGCATQATSSHNACVRGVNAFHQGDYAQASVDFRKAISEDPKNADAIYDMGAVYHRLWITERNPGDAAQAEQYYRDALAINPNMAEAYRGIAVLMTTQGRQQEAIQTLYAWARRDQTSAAPRLELARICEEQNASEAAAQYLAEAESIEPQNPRVLAAIGRLREKAGETNAAAMYYVRATQNSDSPELRAHIASLQNSSNGMGPSANPSQGTYVAANTENEPPFGKGRFLERLSQLFSPSKDPQYRVPATTTQPYLVPNGVPNGVYDGTLTDPSYGGVPANMEPGIYGDSVLYDHGAVYGDNVAAVDGSVYNGEIPYDGGNFYPDATTYNGGGIAVNTGTTLAPGPAPVTR